MRFKILCVDKGQRGLSMRERKTYALVSCILKCNSWMERCTITVVADRDSLFKQCTRKILVPWVVLWAIGSDNIGSSPSKT